MAYNYVELSSLAYNAFRLNHKTKWVLGSGVIVKFQTDMRRCLYKFLLNRTIMHPANIFA